MPKKRKILLIYKINGIEKQNEKFSDFTYKIEGRTNPVIIKQSKISPIFLADK